MFISCFYPRQLATALNVSSEWLHTMISISRVFWNKRRAKQNIQQQGFPRGHPP
jgi:hypothetical protein